MTQSTIITIVLTAAITWIIQYVLKHMFELFNKGKNNKNKEEIISTVAPLLEQTNKKLDYITAKLEVGNEGTKSVLRDSLLRLYRYCNQQGYKTQNESDNFHKMYQSYHDLGGNSFIDEDVKPHFESLPIKEKNN